MMKSMLLSILLVTLSAHGEGKGKSKKHHGDPKCAAVKEACQRAGFKKGAHGNTGKGLSKDCMDKLIEGQKVKGVSLDPKEAAVGQCRAFLTSTGKTSKAGGSTKSKSPKAQESQATTAAKKPAAH